MPLPTDYQNFIHQSRYARWDEGKGRRETWPETVNRYTDFMQKHNPSAPASVLATINQSILSLEGMPSMRALMTAGPAMEADNIAGYNCAYTISNSIHAFDELMYILMCGTGVGFSVERQYIGDLPVISSTHKKGTDIINVADSRVGWVLAFRELLENLWAGIIPPYDLTAIRKKGEKLKTFGGRASGPDPLDKLFKFAINLTLNAAGRKLRSIECHDLICMIASIVVVGGVRRSALISLSNLSDDRMRVAKSGHWWTQNNQRALANNSVCYTEKPDMHSFMREWLSLYDSKSGERGIFNRQASVNQVKRNGRRNYLFEFGTNPCCEIILRPMQFCNLSEVVVRVTDTLDRLIEKVRIATQIGTLQATFTDFKHLNKVWQENTREEALLGVSLTGIMDHPVLSGQQPTFDCGTTLAGALILMRAEAVQTNLEMSKQLGINQSAAITCVKPSGTVSQLVNAASGIHTRYSEYYIRTVRNDAKDPITKMLIDQGVPNEPAIGDEENTVIFSFPVKSPEDAITRTELTAIEQLELWKTYQIHWCEHKPSITVYVREHEWMMVGSWVYENFDTLSGISFLPYDTGIYQQAPYQEITKDEYEAMVSTFPTIDWVGLQAFESEDMTVSSQTLACAGGSCEI